MNKVLEFGQSQNLLNLLLMPNVRAGEQVGESLEFLRKFKIFTQVK